jgi:tetratricopeptide (TPR) repeat protein
MFPFSENWTIKRCDVRIFDKQNCVFSRSNLAYLMNYKYLFLGLLFTGLLSCSNEDSLQGDVYFKNQQYEEAVQAYTDYLKIKPRHIKSLYNRGRSYQELEKYDLAIEDFKAVLKLDPQNESAFLSIGQEMYRNEDYKSTLYYCNHVIELNKSSSMAYYIKARTLHKQGKFRDAMQNYDKTINLAPDMGEAYLHRGALNLLMKKGTEACNDLKKAASLNVEGAQEALEMNC